MQAFMQDELSIHCTQFTGHKTELFEKIQILSLYIYFEVA